MKSKLASASLLIILSSSLAFADSKTEYASGDYEKVIIEVKKEMAIEFQESQEYLARFRLATNSFAQTRSVTLEQLLSVYDAASAPAKKFQYDERMTAERAEVADWLGREQKMTSIEALNALELATKWPEVSVAELTKKSSRLFALALLARRKILAEQADPEWYFVAGKALEADTGSGTTFLEIYLDHPVLKGLSRRLEAVSLIEKAYRRRYDDELPADLQLKLKRWKSPVPVSSKKSK